MNRCLYCMIALLCVANAAADEKVPLNKVPKPVLDAVKARFKGAKLNQAEKEIENGKTIYEINILYTKQKIDVSLTEKGEMLMIEKSIAKKNLPKAVAAALEKAYPKATYRIVEEIIQVKGKKETLINYEVLLIKADKKIIEVKTGTTGKIVKVENKASADED